MSLSLWWKHTKESCSLGKVLLVKTWLKMQALTLRDYNQYFSKIYSYFRDEATNELRNLLGDESK